MKDGTAAADDLADIIGAAQVADDLLDVEAFEVGCVGSRLDQGDDLLAAGEQVAGDGGADEPGRTGDEDAIARFEPHRRDRCRVPLAMVLPNS